MISQNQTTGIKRQGLKSVGESIKSFPHTPLKQKTKSVSQQMMEEFLERQKEYEKINKTNYRNYEPNHTQAQTDQEEFHLFKDAVKEAKLRFQQSHPNSRNLNANNQKKQNYEHLTETVRMKHSLKNSKQVNSQAQEQQIDIGLILIIAIPIICGLVLLSELLK